MGYSAVMRSILITAKHGFFPSVFVTFAPSGSKSGSVGQAPLPLPPPAIRLSAVFDSFLLPTLVHLCMARQIMSWPPGQAATYPPGRVLLAGLTIPLAGPILLRFWPKRLKGLAQPERL